MKKALSLALSLVMMISCFAIGGITAFASILPEEAIRVKLNEPTKIETKYDKDPMYEDAHCWVKFTPETTGSYFFNLPGETDDNMFFTTVFYSLNDAKELNFEHIKEAEGYIFGDDDISEIDGMVYNLNGGHTYYIDIEVWDFENPKNEPVLTLTVTPHTHAYRNFKYPADADWDGSYGKECKYCGATKDVVKIPYVKTIKLSTTSYTYDGKTKKPTVTVKDAKGKALVNGTDYTITYPSGRTKVGKYTVTIKFKGNYEGTVKKTFEIKPKKTSISSLTAQKKGFTVKWNKQSSQTTGYQVQYSTSDKFSNATTLTFADTSKTSKKVTDLRGGKKYYVRVRTYKKVTVNGKSTKVYSNWSKTKAITTKRF